MDRRSLLRGLGAMACSAAAHPLLSTVTLAKGAPALGENRLVVDVALGRSQNAARLVGIGRYLQPHEARPVAVHVP